MTCDGPKNNRCKNPVVIEPLPATWYGLWSDFDSTFTPVNDCGSGGVDIWFQVRLSGSGSLTVSSPDSANVRQILSCSDSSCLAWVYTPDNALHITGAPGDVVIVVASQTSTEERALALTFSP